MRETKRESRIRKAIEREASLAEGGDNSSALTAKRQEALAYYEGSMPAAYEGDTAAHNSSVSMDVASGVNATLSLMRSMLIDEVSVEFEATGPEDEQQAAAETQIVQDAIFKDEPGKLVLMSALKDGLLSGQSCVSVQPRSLGEDENGVEQVEFRLLPVPSEAIRYQAAYEGRFQELRFWAEEIPFTRGELVELGVPKAKVEHLHRGTVTTGAREQRNASQSANRNATTNEREGDVIYCNLVFIKLDLDGDGVQERYRVLAGPKTNYTILSYERDDVIPYALGWPFLTPYRLTGESLFDRLKGVQDSNTRLQRQMFNNIAVNNNGRVIYNPDAVNEEDIMSPEPGGGIRARDVGQVLPMPALDMTDGILRALEYNRQKRSELAGGALDMVSAEAQIMAKTATQASIDKNNSELITTLIADTLAQTLMRDLFQLMHYMLRTYSTRPYIARVAGAAVPVNPLAFAPQRRLNIQCGKSPAEKNQQIMALTQHLNNQVMALQSGKDGILADDRTIYRTSLALLKLNGITNPETFAIDPDSEQAQQAAMMAQQMAQQQQAALQQMAQQQVQLEQAKIAEDGRQADAKIRHDYYATDMQAEIAEAKIAGQGVIDLEKQRMANEQQDARADRGNDQGAAEQI